MSRLTWDGTADPVSRDQILRHERGQGNVHFSCSADHVQDWQPYPVDPYSCFMCDHIISNMFDHTKPLNGILYVVSHIQRSNSCQLEKKYYLFTRWPIPLLVSSLLNKETRIKKESLAAHAPTLPHAARSEKIK